MEDQESEVIEQTRINKRIIVLGGMAVLAAVVLWIGLSTRPRDAAQVSIGYIENFPLDTVTPLILNVHFNDRGPLVIQDKPLPHDIFPLRIFIVSDAQAGLLALYNRDPHAGCQVLWVEGDDHFADPCHASLFNRTGEYLFGPAPRGLDRFAIIATDNGELFIDLKQYQLGTASGVQALACEQQPEGCTP